MSTRIATDSATDLGGAVPVRLRYWAGAGAAAGVDSEVIEAATVGAALAEAVRRHPALGPVVAVSACLLDGVRAGHATPLSGTPTLEVLPPFAGG